MNKLQQSWSSFSDKIASEYLITYGHPSSSSKKLLVDIIRKKSNRRKVSIIDLGCGNAHLFGFFKENNISFEYTGVDFSEPLLKEARKQYPDMLFIKDDVNELSKIDKHYDIALYSHVIEMLPSPESSILSAKKIADMIIIRFFEPPIFDVDTVELKEMDLGEGKVPYLRRKMSRDYYRLILTKAGVNKVEIYKDNNSKDEIHVIY